ncbi:MAG: hypothetical protein JWL76_1644 [Thermoleophilia bacterium]|nr:hypothetical protein [Thermoleophilia bacterium]
MEEPLRPDELTELLQHELARASEQGALGVHLQLTVPASSAYRWSDDEGDEHGVFLPTQLKAELMHMRGEPHEDGGPAAVFRVVAGGIVPSEQLTEAAAAELYRQCVRWGRIHHARWDEAPPDDLPELPGDFDDIVESAMFMDVS